MKIKKIVSFILALTVFVGCLSVLGYADTPTPRDGGFSLDPLGHKDLGKRACKVDQTLVISISYNPSSIDLTYGVRDSNGVVVRLHSKYLRQAPTLCMCTILMNTLTLSALSRRNCMGKCLSLEGKT